jgi:Carnosine N-methyltransferase
MSARAEQIGPLLACPRCDRAVERSASGYRCDGCKVDFPDVGGLPCLFAEPGAALGAWRERYRLLTLALDRDVDILGRTLAREGLRATTRSRLARLEAATKDHRARLAELLSPLGVDTLCARYETYLALRTRLPPEQGINTYYANAHRDWAWGDTENAAAFDALAQSLPEDGAFGKTLVLGAGAGRLAYDIQMSARAALTVALDFNPMLMLLAHRVAAGETVELYEFPIAPKHSEDVATLRALKAEQPADGRLQFVIADALRAPFRRGAFDTVVTPWFIDIVSEDFDTLCLRVAGLLAAGGQWLNFGSLSFHHADPALCYGLEECREAMAETGFIVTSVEEREIPYMCSPASRHGRRETVVTWRAVKNRDGKSPPRHSALPDWIVKGDTPVPLLREFRTQAMSTRIYAYIMSLIDGHRSLRDIAQVLHSQQMMSADEAEPAIRSFLIKMYDETRRDRGY